MVTLKKIIKFLWPILLRAFLLEIEREIQHKLYGKGYSRKTVNTGKYARPVVRERSVVNPPMRSISESLASIEVYFESMKALKETQNQMVDLAGRYDVCTVADLFERIGLDNHVRNHHSIWGWSRTDIENAEVLENVGPDGRGVGLKFPKPTRVGEFKRARYSYLDLDPTVGYLGYAFHEEQTAQEVLDRLNNIIDENGYVTVEDFHELVGETGSFVDAKWGWKNLDDVKVTLDADEDNDNMDVWVIKMTQKPVPVG